MKTILLLLSCLGVAVRAAEPAAPGRCREPFAESFPIRREQHLQIKAYADRLLQEQADRALRAVEPDFSSVEAYQRSLQPHRERLQTFFGTPPPGAKEGRVTKFLQVGEDAECTVFRVWVEVIDGVEAYGLLDQKLRLAGTSIIGLELPKILESTRTLLRVRPEIDGARVGMTGLSWGGFFTMYATALSPLIKVAAPSGYFRDYEQLLARATADTGPAAILNFFDKHL